ncbi:MAG TPA: DUF4919 domain-containing protein [Bacteroidales bacterium]|nr:DUF4919 domain-containing protein [Bacteroidales bacterium]
MKRICLLIVLFTALTINMNAQDEFFNSPNYSQIEANVKEQSSSYYYPNLLKKYLDANSEMTLEEARHLYYGYVFQTNYVPTDTSTYNNKLAITLSRGSFTPSDYAEILEYSNALLLQDPFNLRALNAKLLVLAQQNKPDEYKKVAQQRSIVQNAIVSSGDGMTEKTAFYVIKVAHEYDILPFLGYTYGGEDKILRGNKVNYLSLGENRFGIERVYFNITPVIEYVNAHGGGKM